MSALGPEGYAAGAALTIGPLLVAGYALARWLWDWTLP